MKRLIIALSFVAASLPAGSVVAAEATQPLDSITAAVEDFLRAETADFAVPAHIEPSPLDPRLRLSLCERPLEAFFPAGSRKQGNITVGVRCTGAAPWSIYVPAKVQVYDRVVVAARPLSRGSLLAAGDVEVRELDVTALAGGYLSSPEQVVGRSLRRNVQFGAAIGPGMIELPKIIRRGERVQILARTAGMEVRMEGEALEDGAEGEVIRVRNRSSRRSVEGLVTGPGMIEVRL
ncbi:MAG: flagellar basal body P-ring formation chaperone FlgA [Thiohalomonadaceae bacterium]